MASPSASDPLLGRRGSSGSEKEASPTQPEPRSIFQKLKYYFLALFSSIFLFAALPQSISESQQLLVHRKTYTTQPHPSAARPPKSHAHDRIRVHTLPAKYIPDPHLHTHSHRRLIIVGDVHGCKHELLALLDKVDFHATTDHLILAGDFVNKGPDSHGVVALARDLGASCVRGNHEDKLLKALAAAADDRSPIKDKKLATTAKQLTQGDIAFIESCPHLLSLGHIPGLPFANTVVVHGGLEAGVSLHEQDPFAVMNMRAIDPKTGRPEEKRGDGVAWWRVWNKAQRRLRKAERTLVVYGHDSKQGFVENEYSVGLDSGCVNGGRLTALLIGDEHEKGMRVVSVRSRVKD